MRPLLVVLSLINAAALAAAVPSKLAAGRYDLKVSGFWCTTCGRAMENELKALPEVESVSFDFEAETVTLTVKLDHELKLSALRKALARASKRVNIGSKLDVVAVIYKP